MICPKDKINAIKDVNNKKTKTFTLIKVALSKKFILPYNRILE